MYLDFDFLNIDHKNLKPAQGRILISEPMLTDTYFRRSVVFLTEHSDKGAVGFVLNKPIDMPIYEIMADFPNFESTVYVGGPVGKDTIHFIHTLGELVKNSVHVVDDIYWGGDFDCLKELIREGMVKSDQVKFFLGYSGWSPNQLEDEIEDNAWLVADMDSGIIMKADHNIWERTLKELGDKYQVWANFPDNPTMN